MLKLVVFRFLVFFGILLLTLLAYIGYHLFEINYYLFGARDAGANVEVWLDKNGDGYKDSDEPPLGEICVWAGYASDPPEEYTYSLFSSWEEICAIQGYRTDANGKWDDFFPGGDCSEIHMLVNLPVGYQPTTSPAVNGCVAKFGLTQGRPLSEIQTLSAEEYIRKQVAFERLGQILALLVVVAVAAFSSIKLVHPTITQ